MTKKLSFYGLMVSLSFILSYIETLIPVFTSIPGIKLGLANIVTVFVLNNTKKKDAIYITIARILLISITFGNFSLMAYSLAGATFSLTFMILLKMTKLFDIITISIIGSVAHNIGQLLLAAIIISSFNIMYYLPFLMIAGIIFGAIIGIFVKILSTRIKYRR